MSAFLVVEAYIEKEAQNQSGQKNQATAAAPATSSKLGTPVESRPISCAVLSKAFLYHLDGQQCSQKVMSGLFRQSTASFLSVRGSNSPHQFTPSSSRRPCPSSSLLTFNSEAQTRFDCGKMLVRAIGNELRRQGRSVVCHSHLFRAAHWLRFESG